MEVKQIYELVNEIVKENIGEESIVNEDLSNLVDIGDVIINRMGTDAYCKAVVNKIGKTVFVNRPYSGIAPSILMEKWEYGSIKEKIRMELPEFEENESWQLVNGQSYDPNVFKQPKIHSKFFNNLSTFEVDMSFTDIQVKQSFQSATSKNAFFSMIYTQIDNTLTMAMDSLTQRIVNNMTAETLTNGSPTAAVNLLTEYNTQFGETLTPSAAIYDPEFIRYATARMAEYVDMLTGMSTLFNVGKTNKFTPKSELHVIMLSKFKSNAATYLQADTFHNEYTALPKAESMPYWQGTGTGYTWDDISSIDVKTATGATVKQSGILAVMFDHEALGMSNADRRVRSNDNGKAEFTNMFYKQDVGSFNDLDENFVVFYVA